MKLKLRKVDPVKYSLIAAIIAAVFSLILIPYFIFLDYIMGMSGADAMADPVLGLLDNFMIIIACLLPLIYFGMTFIISLLALLMFNFLLSKMNGIEFDIDVVEPVEINENETIEEVEATEVADEDMDEVK